MSEPGAGLRFTKLEALGNDFVLLDFRNRGSDQSHHPSLTPDQIQALADRHTGIGFDQLLTLHPPRTSAADCQIHIYNADGSPAHQCGNGMRAVAWWLHQAGADSHQFLFETAAGPVTAQVDSAQAISVSMGQPDFRPEAVGLLNATRLHELGQEVPGLLRMGTVSVGNPHLVMLLEHAATARLVEHLGRPDGLQQCFADGVNLSFAAMLSPQRVGLRVHERGVGPTRACGSAACATAAWLIDQGLMQTPVQIEQPGGRLVIDWSGQDQPLIMRGPARRVFEGQLP